MGDQHSRGGFGGRPQGGNGRPHAPKTPAAPSKETQLLASFVGQPVLIKLRTRGDVYGVLAWFGDHSLGLTPAAKETILVMKGDVSTIELVTIPAMTVSSV